MLTKQKKPFQDGELLNEAFLTGTDCLFERFSNKHEIVSAIQDIQLSDNTVTRRIHAISTDKQTQLNGDLEICDWFSLQFDESTDKPDTAQVAVMMRMVFGDFTVKEELLKILPIKDALLCSIINLPSKINGARHTTSSRKCALRSKVQKSWGPLV